MPLQAQAIVSLATQMAKVAGYTAQAGQLLNMVLFELCETYDFELARATTTFNFNGTTGPYNLPANFLRCLPDDFYYVYQPGYPYFPVWADRAEYDRFIQVPQIASMPSRYMIDMAQVVVPANATGTTPGLAPNPDGVPQLWVWPPPSGSWPCNMTYYQSMPDIATPETSSVVPWFPCQDYLITRLAGELMKISDDDRAGAFLGDGDGKDGRTRGAQNILRSYLEMKDDKDETIQSVKLDRRHFGVFQGNLREDKVVTWGAQQP